MRIFIESLPLSYNSYVMDIQLDNETVSRSGDEIMTQETILGTLVTVYRETDPDSPSEELTLIVPDINLTDELPKVRFKGVSHLIYVVVAGCVGERWTVQPRYFTA
jgi:hypothetical protein